MVKEPWELVNTVGGGHIYHVPDSLTGPAY